MTKGFKLSPSEVDKGGSSMLDFGSKADQHGTGTASAHKKITSSGSGKSSIVKTIVDFGTKSGDAFTGMFKQISRVSKEAGNRLKTGSKSTKQTETDVESSIKKIQSPTADSHDRPRGPESHGQTSSEQTETSAAAPATPHTAPTTHKETPGGSDTSHQGGDTIEPSAAPKPHGETGSTGKDPESSSGHEPPVEQAPKPKSKVAPAPDRLNSWLGNADKPEVSKIQAHRPPPAQSHFGETGHDQMYDIEQQSHDYQGNGSAERPTSGGRFETAFTTDGNKHSAVVMETYMAGGANKPTYTASDGFLHQWGAAHAGFNTDGSNKQKMNAITGHLGSNDSYPDRLPNKLPDTIYHQNISGDGPKQTLGNILDGKDSPHQLSSSELDQVLKTDNGKQVNNVVGTYNDVMGDTGGGPYNITGGAVGKDGQGNYHLKFDIGKK